MSAVLFHARKRFVDRRDYSSQLNDSSDVTQNYTVDETTRPTTSTAVESNDADDSAWYPVTRILATKTKGGKKYFKVEWEDTKSKPTWVQEDDVTDSLKRTLYANQHTRGRRRSRRAPQFRRKAP